MNAFAQHWNLDPRVLYLNHGAYGACPRRVLQAQNELRDEIERNPLAFFERRYNPLLDAARERLARFVGADVDGLVRVPNPTRPPGSTPCCAAWSFNRATNCSSPITPTTPAATR